MIQRLGIWALAATGAALLLLPLAGSRFAVELTNHILIMSLFAVSFNLLLGYTGLASFGQAAYFGIGAYTCAILLTKSGVPLLGGLVAAFLASAAAAVVIGYFCVRLTQIYFAMLTLAFSQIVWAISWKWTALTGGDNGFVGVRIPALVDSPTRLYYFTLVVVATGLALLLRVVRSPFGQILTTIRENPERAGFIGVNVRFVQLLAFIIAGAFAGVAGALFSLLSKSVFPDSVLWTRSAEVLIITIMGGMYTFLGPVVGAAVFLVLESLVIGYTEYWPFVMGIVLLVLLYFFPSGLAGFVSAWARRVGARP